MTGNRETYRWCKRCQRWVLAFPLAGQWCDACWLDWMNDEKNELETELASQYLMLDYAARAMV